MIKVGVFSKLSRITIKMLRYYDEIGLLVPQYIDSETNYRYYTDEQLITTNKITLYKNIGFSLNEIKELLQHDNHPEILATYFKIREHELIEEQQELFEKIKKLSELYHDSEQTQIDTPYTVVQKQFPIRYVASVRQKLQNYDDEYMLWNLLYDELSTHNISPINDGYTMAIYHDDDFKESDIDIEVQVTVEGVHANTSIVQFFETQSSDMATIIFNGSYDKVSFVTQTLATWLDTNAYTLNGPTCNIFHVSPAQSNNPNDWITETCYSIEKRSNKNGKTDNKK